MGITVQHVKTSLIADDADTSLVRPSDWNSTHAITFSPDASEVIKVISAGAQSVSSGSVVFANSNGVTFGMNNGTITASVPAVGGAQTGISGIGAAGGTATSGTVIFSNSNGLAFGMNGQTMTGSYTVPTQTAFVLSNSNNVSFGTNGSTVTASASFPAQTVDTNKAGTGFTSGGAGIGLSGTLNTNGLSLSATVPTQTVQPVAVSGSNGSFAFSTVSFGNSNGLSFYSTNGSLVGSYTVPSVPAQTQQPMYFSASNSNTSANTLQFGNSNGVSFSISNGSLVATVKTDYLTSQTAQTAGLYAAGNTTGQSSSTTADARSLSFQGAGVASVGYSNGSVIVSVPAGGGGGDGFNQAGFTNSTANSTMSLVWAGNSAGSGNVTMGLTGSTITMSAPAGAGGGIAAAAGTQTATSGTVAFANSNGISFGMSGSNQITASYTVPTIPGATVFSNSNNVSFGLAGSTVTATATWPAQTVQPAVGQLNGSSGTMSFAVGSSLSASSNASTITFGLASNWSTTIMPLGNSTAYATSVLSNTFLTTAANSTHSHGNPTLALTNLTGTTASASNGFTLSLSAAAPGGGGAVNVSAGTTSGNLQTLQFDNGNGVSFGLNGSTITASINAGGVANPITYCAPYFQGSSTRQRIYAAGNPVNNAWFQPVQLLDPVAFNELWVAFSQNTTSSTNQGGVSYTVHYGLYSKNGGTLSRISASGFTINHTLNSVSGTISYPVSTATTGYSYGTTTATATTQQSALWGPGALRVFGCQFGNTVSLSPGQYWLGMLIQNNASGGGSILMDQVGNVAIQHMSAVPLGVQYASVSSSQTYGRMINGQLTATSVTNFAGTTLPPFVVISQLQNTLSFLPYVTFIST